MRVGAGPLVGSARVGATPGLTASGLLPRRGAHCSGHGGRWGASRARDVSQQGHAIQPRVRPCKPRMDMYPVMACTRDGTTRADRSDLAMV